MTIHVRAEPGQYAEAVLLPGDPLRAKYIAETYLEDVVQRNAERGLLGYTGTYNGKPVLNAKLEPAVAANPYLSFFVKVEESGTLKFTWTDDNKQSWTAESKIEVA